jgi:virginiamycin B lyase
MPDPKARYPHTPLFDKNGILWFSVQNGGFMGRLDPKTGDIKLFTPNGPSGQQPYALRFLSDGLRPWFSYWGSNKIATIDPVTFELKEYVQPDPRTRIRRMGVTSDDMLWYGNWGTGKLARFNPQTGQVTEWESPSGQQSQPYGMTVIDDKVWYVESNTRPNNLVRFDPKTEKFQTWQIPGGGGIVRHMMPTPDGKIAMAMSGLNTVGIVEILPSSSN